MLPIKTALILNFIELKRKISEIMISLKSEIETQILFTKYTLYSKASFRPNNIPHKFINTILLKCFSHLHLISDFI